MKLPDFDLVTNNLHVRFQVESTCHLDHFIESGLHVGREVLPARSGCIGVG
jgi:hypothetical protein